MKKIETFSCRSFLFNKKACGKKREREKILGRRAIDGD
jgi:hypothetical protein